MGFKPAFREYRENVALTFITLCSTKPPKLGRNSLFILMKYSRLYKVLRSPLLRFNFCFNFTCGFSHFDGVEVTSEYIFSGFVMEEGFIAVVNLKFACVLMRVGANIFEHVLTR